MIETKKHPSNEREIIEMYKAFGWEETGEEPAAKKKQPSMIVLARDTNMAHFQEIKVLEGTFNSHLSRKVKVPEIDYGVAVLCFLLAIIPCFIYVASVKSRKAKAIKKNEEETNYLKNMCIEAKKIRSL